MVLLVDRRDFAARLRPFLRTQEALELVLESETEDVVVNRSIDTKHHTEAFLSQPPHPSITPPAPLLLSLFFFDGRVPLGTWMYYPFSAEHVQGMSYICSIGLYVIHVE